MKNTITLSCIFNALTFHLTKPGFANLEWVLSLGYFPLNQMSDPNGGWAITSGYCSSFSRAHTLEKPDGNRK